MSLEAWLVSRDASKRALAAETMALMGTEQSLQYLLALASAEEKKLTRRNISVVFLWGCLFAGCTVVQTTHRIHLWIDPSSIMIGLTSFVGMLAGRPCALHKRTIELVCESKDIRALPILIRRWKSAIMSGALGTNLLAQAVARTLPALNADDIELLSKGDWQFLLKQLTARRTKAMSPEVHRELVRAILLTCGTVGKVEALPYMKTIAESKSKSPEIQQLQSSACHYMTLLQNTNIPQIPRQMAVRR